MAARKQKAAGAAVPADTRATLIRGAMLEFNQFGYVGTDSNRIARRAGFAPQTFYRWFKDKTEIFVAVYQSWEEGERKAIDELLGRRASTQRLVEHLVAHHRDHKIFRRSLRQLSLEEATIRAERAASRTRQVEQIRLWRKQYAGAEPIGAPALAVLLLQIERLADALAEDELADMGMSTTNAVRALGELIERLRTAE